MGLERAFRIIASWPMKPWGWIGLALVGLLLLGALGALGEEESSTNTDDDVVADYTREKAVSYMADAFRFLALEYGHRLNEDSVKEMLAEALEDYEPEGWDYGVILLDWWDTPAEKADTLRSALLEEGQVPEEAMANFANKVEEWETTNAS